MRDQWEQLRQREQSLAAQRPVLVQDIQELKHRLAELREEPCSTALGELVASSGQYEQRCETWAQLEQQQRAATVRWQSLQQRLAVVVDSPAADLLESSVPLAATVKEYHQQHAGLQRRQEQVQQRLQQIQQEQSQRQRELAALQESQPVPSRQQLDDARAQRDALWQLIRRRLAGQTLADHEITAVLGPAQRSLEDAYTDRVRRADELADQRQAQAEVVARLDQLTGTIQLLDQQEAGLQTEQAQGQADLATWQQRWQALWEPANLVPSSPDAMLQWLQIYDELLGVDRQLRELASQAEAQRAWTGRYLAELATCLPAESGSPTQQVVAARRRWQEVQEAAAERKSCLVQLPRKRQQLESLQHHLADVTQQREQWQRAWRQLLAELGWPTQWDVRTVEDVLQRLGEARLQYQQAQSLVERVKAMQRGLHAFEDEVRRICQVAAPQLLGHPPELAVQQLAELAEQARRDLQQQQTLRQRQDRLIAWCESKQSQLLHELRSIAQLVSLAQVADEGAVPDVVRRVQQWHQANDQLQSLEQQLSAVRGDQDSTRFTETLDHADAAELESQRRMLDSQRRQIEEQFDAALQAQGVAAQRLESLTQANQSMVLSQELENTRSQFVEAVDQWVPLTLARACMSAAIERFEREHQPRLLVDISRLLQQMTLGRYTQLSRKLDEHGTLLVHQADGQVKEPHQLSTGTREQLYLAIRLAYVMHYCRDAEPLPIVMDDVLVNFDDRRAAATFDALAVVGQQVQLILLTCHQYTLDLARTRIAGLKPILLAASQDEQGDDDGAQRAVDQAAQDTADT